jgi:hypothetical protein
MPASPGHYQMYGDLQMNGQISSYKSVQTYTLPLGCQLDSVVFDMAGEHVSVNSVGADPAIGLTTLCRHGQYPLTVLAGDFNIQRLRC